MTIILGLGLCTDNDYIVLGRQLLKYLRASVAAGSKREDLVTYLLSTETETRETEADRNNCL